MKKRLRIFVVLIIAALILSATDTTKAEAAIKDKDAVRAIIGEASGEGYRGMLAVACGIRNRGTLKGVYGLHARHVDKEPGWVWDLARKAWKESEHNDIVGGAGHWEMSSRIPWWAKGMIVTAKIGHHTFYKEIRVAQKEDLRDEDGNRWRDGGDGSLYNDKGDRLYRGCWSGIAFFPPRATKSRWI